MDMGFDPFSGNPSYFTRDQLGTLTLEDYGLTPEAVKANHFGIDVRHPKTGQYLPDAFYEQKLRTAVNRAEMMLNIDIIPRLRPEKHDYQSSSFQSYHYIKTYKKPILHVESFSAAYGGQSHHPFPEDWWKVYNLPGQIQMMPHLMMSAQGNLDINQFFGSLPFAVGLPAQVQGQSSAPQVFQIEYISGMLPPRRDGIHYDWDMPENLYEMILKIALIEIFNQYGRLIIGPGIADIQIEQDGISQKIGTTQSAMYGGASAEIMQVEREVAEMKKELMAYFGFNIGLI